MARLTQMSNRMPVDEGKMFGVLVVVNGQGVPGFLSAFSGMLDGQWQVPGFVPPVFDMDRQKSFLSAGERALDNLTADLSRLQDDPGRLKLQAEFHDLVRQRDCALEDCRQKQIASKVARSLAREALSVDPEIREKQLARLSRESQQDKREKRRLRKEWDERLAAVQKQLDVFDDEISRLKQVRQQLSQSLHDKVFANYQLANRLGEQRGVADFFNRGLPPGGTGDCAGPKLIQYAVRHGMKPIALAEFWWGASPASGVRHHGQFYPACRGKCKPILPFMLRGLPLESAPTPPLVAADGVLEIVHEDDDLIVVDKPAGLLSVPGIDIKDSVLVRLRERYPNATGPLLVHRLDLATSGLLLAAKNRETHKQLQRQFIKRSIRKRYIAELEGELQADQGVIELPLRVDLDDRPRQLVCAAWGKPAQTRWEVISRQSGRTSVFFYPLTGRTHQLRVHAAHRDGLAAPIVGDELYGRRAARLMLHAEEIRFLHPGTGKWQTVRADCPF